MPDERRRSAGTGNPASAPSQERAPRPRVALPPASRLLAWAVLAVAGALALAGLWLGADGAMLRAGAVMLLAVGLWVSGAIPEYLTAVSFFFAAVILGVAPPEVVFSGFHSSAVWLVFGGMVLGLAVRESGLGDRAVRLMIARLPHGRYMALVFAVVVASVALAFFIPSAMSRVLLLTPIVVAVADRLGFAAGSNGRAGLVIAAGMGTTLPTFAILPSNVPNMVLQGAAESIYGLSFSYGGYMAVNFMVLGFASLIAISVLTGLILNDEARPEEVETAKTGWSRDERVLMAVLAATVALWMSDFWHGLSPAWVALGAALLCVLPRIGPLEPRALAERVNYGPWLFVAGVIGLGAVATHSGLAALAARELVALAGFEPGRDAHNFAALAGIGMVLSLLVTHPAQPAIMTPLAGDVAAATGWPLASVLLVQVPTWVVFAFPYQAPPLLVAMTIGQVPVRKAVPVLAAHCLVGLVVMLPLHFLWGRALGYFGAG